MKSLFTIIFKDNSNFLGGSLTETKWLDIPNKPIKRIIYNLSNNNNLVLNNYDSYFHMIEATTDLNGENQGKTILEYAYIMGEKKDYVEVYKISLINGDIQKFNYNISDNFIQKLNPDGWKKGENNERQIWNKR